MTEDERRALGRTRRLVFSNIANGVPVERVMADLKLSQLEVDQALRFVGRKITGWLVVQRQPPIACDSVRDIRWNRRRLLGVLARIGDLDLSTTLFTKMEKGELVKVELGKITVQSLDHPEMVEGAKRRMAEAQAR